MTESTEKYALLGPLRQLLSSTSCHGSSGVTAGTGKAISFLTGLPLYMSRYGENRIIEARRKTKWRTEYTVL